MSDIDIQWDGKKYFVEIRHDGLNKFAIVRGASEYEVEEKARAQAAAWSEMWSKKVAADQQRAAKEEQARSREAKKQQAAQRTSEAEAVLEELRHLLDHTLDVDDRLDWEGLKDQSSFAKPKPQVARPAEPVPPAVPDMPRRGAPKYQPNLGVAELLVPGRKQQKIGAANNLYLADVRVWKHHKETLEAQSAADRRAYEAQLVQWRAEVQNAEAAWEAERRAFEERQAKKNASVEAVRQEYAKGTPAAVKSYCGLVLARSVYPSVLGRRTFELGYEPATKILVVDYELPSPEDLPKVKGARYVQSRDALEEVPLPAQTLKALYDGLLYQITLRTIHELFEADTINAIDMVVFNGWVNSINKATGQDVRACVLSLQAKREEFLSISLQNIDPKECFRQLKGIGSAKLHGLAPVAPILQLNRQDKRFVAAQDVSDQLSESVNLAAMDWEEFEHLIREVFEREFAQSGGEVKVTQASRDGGVDAVAFDPDPIRGGKILIQAKRYTNTVGVSAVRDLYGTVLNEGATKGILVTTSNYGPDAHEFAKGKPLTLLNGNNLLYLLEKHGHKARIDLQEAKRIQQNG